MYRHHLASPDAPSCGLLELHAGGERKVDPFRSIAATSFASFEFVFFLLISRFPNSATTRMADDADMEVHEEEEQERGKAEITVNDAAGLTDEELRELLLPPGWEFDSKGVPIQRADQRGRRPRAEVGLVFMACFHDFSLPNSDGAPCAHRCCLQGAWRN